MEHALEFDDWSVEGLVDAGAAPRAEPRWPTVQIKAKQAAFTGEIGGAVEDGHFACGVRRNVTGRSALPRWISVGQVGQVPNADAPVLVGDHHIVSVHRHARLGIPPCFAALELLSIPSGVVDPVETVLLGGHPDVGGRGGHRGGHPDDGRGARPAALGGVVDRNQVVAADVDVVSKSGQSGHLRDGWAGGKNQVVLDHRRSAGCHTEEGARAVAYEEGVVAGRSCAAGRPSHHDRDVAAKPGFGQIGGAVVGGEHARIDVVAFDGRTCEHPEFVAHHFNPVDLVVGQPICAGPRGLPEVEGGVVPSNAGIGRTEQDLSAHLHHGRDDVGMQDVRRGPNR